MSEERIKTLRLTFPQWQGGDPGYLMERLSEFSRQDATQGYIWGSKILNVIAPETYGPKAEVPVSHKFTEEELEIVDGIYAKKPILEQLKQAMLIIKKHAPDKIITLGGECSVSTAPFSYLAEKYKDDVSFIWLDAHCDLSVPHDSESDIGFHAMGLSHILGLGDKDILAELPGKGDPSKVVFIGLRAYTDYQIARIEQLKIPHYTPEEFRSNPRVVQEFIKTSKVLVHLDLDCIDPCELVAAVGRDPNGMKIAEVIECIKLISEVSDIVGFTVAEHMPTVEMKLRNLLKSLPVF